MSIPRDLLVQLIQLLRNAHRRTKLNHSSSPEAVTTKVVQSNWHYWDVHPVLIQRAERNDCHPSLHTAARAFEKLVAIKPMKKTVKQRIARQLSHKNGGWDGLLDPETRS